jgi:hypothetical protein
VDSASPRGLTRPAKDNGAVQGERLSKRQRRHRKPFNIFTLGGDMDGPPTERACYLAAAALGTKTDDTNPMHSQVLEKLGDLHGSPSGSHGSSCHVGLCDEVRW